MDTQGRSSPSLWLALVGAAAWLPQIFGWISPLAILQIFFVWHRPIVPSAAHWRSREIRRVKNRLVYESL